MTGIYYEPTTYAWQLQQDRLDREWEKQDLPGTYPPSPSFPPTAAGDSPDITRCDGTRGNQVVVDTTWLVATGWLPASHLEE